MNDQQDIHQQIESILAHLDGQHSTNDEGEEHVSHVAADEQATTGHYQQQPTQTIIDVYIIEREQDEEERDEDAQTIEGTLETATPEQQNEGDLFPPQPTPTPPVREARIIHRTWWMVALITLCLLLTVSAGTGIVFWYLLIPSAHITLTIHAQQLTTTSSVHLITNGAADPTRNQLAGRMLPSVTMSQARTLPTTGTTRQMATTAHGFITLYNAAPYAQMVSAGTLLAGADGMQVLTDQDAMITAAVPPTEGQVTVGGHTVVTGPQGNIRAGDLYGLCCRLNVFVTNSAFHGGQNARTYQTVTAQDIAGVVRTLTTSVEQSLQAALQTQVTATETLVIPLACMQQVTPDHHAGEEATQVEVMLSETCVGIVYSTQALTTLATMLATTDAHTRLGTGYTTTGVQTTVIHTSPNKRQPGSIDMQIQSVGLWAYPFTPEQQDSMKAMIAGMRKDKATSTLLHMTGVQSVSITLAHGTTLPKDVQQIHLLFLQV